MLTYAIASTFMSLQLIVFLQHLLIFVIYVIYKCIQLFFVSSYNLELYKFVNLTIAFYCCSYRLNQVICM